MAAVDVRTPAATVLALVAALALAMLTLAGHPAAAQPDDDGVSPARVDGADRYETAAEIARLTFDTATSAVIASGENFPDALVASYGPLGVDAPVLLSRQHELPEATIEALHDLNVGTVFLMGGEAALGAEIGAQLDEEGIDEWFRVAGDNRYETAAATLTGPEAPTVGTLEGDRTALLASGENFPDALAAGPVAASADLPLLLTTPTFSAHTVTAAEAMRQDGVDVERVVIVGGTAAVGSDVEDYFRDELNLTVERWSGADRLATAADVADNALARLGFEPELTLLARGDAFADALAAGPHGGALGAPLLLTHSPGTLGSATDAWLAAACPEIGAVRAIGGAAAVSDATLGAAVAAAERCLVDDEITAVVVSDEQITDQDGNVVLSIDDVPDTIRPDPDTEFGGPTHFADAVLSDDGTWLAIGSAGAAHGYGSLYDIRAGAHHFVAFQFEGTVSAHSWSPDDRFALFTIGTPAGTGLLKVVDRDDIRPHAAETGFVVEVDEEAQHEPPFAYEFTEWQPPHTLCFTFEGTPYCVDADTGEPEPAE